MPVFHPSIALTTLSRKTDATLQATRVLVNGGTDPNSLPGSLGRARWRGGAPAGLVIALTDRNGGMSPIGFDNQWVNNYLLRVKTGRTYLITASNAAAGTVTLSPDVSNIAADEDFEFRLDEPNTNTRRVTQTGAGYTQMPIAISNVAGAVFTVIDNWLGTDPVTADGQYTDWRLRRASLVATPTFSQITAAGVLTVSSVAGINAGDLVICGLTALNYGYQGGCGGILVVDTVNAGPVTLSCHSRDGQPISPNAFGAGFTARIYRPVATTHLVTASAAAGNTITVDAAGTAAVNDMFEIIQLCGNGEQPLYVDHPTYSVAPMAS